ncbi:MAG: flagellar hook-basal body protein [Phycisphaeraceae bacterium JB051]
MNYGLYLSASGVLSNTYRQDVYANNLANAQTVGFKVDVPSIKQRDPESIEDDLGYMVSKDMLDRLGGGVLAGTQWTHHDRSQFKQTDNPFDLALDAEQTYFAVQVPDKQGNLNVELTRDGRFTRDSQGFLATVTGGHKVLGVGDAPIQLPADGDVMVQSNGQILVNGEEVGRLQVTGVQDANKLTKRGQNLFAMPSDIEDFRQLPDRVAILQGFTEQSSVDPIKTLMQLTEATKTANGNANMIKYQDQLLDRAINTLGRV